MANVGHYAKLIETAQMSGVFINLVAVGGKGWRNFIIGARGGLAH